MYKFWCIAELPCNAMWWNIGLVNPPFLCQLSRFQLCFRMKFAYAEYIFITDNWSAISAKPLPSPPSSIIVICCRFFDALLAKETRRSQRYRLQLSSFDISKNEFLCPLCETISNTVLPLMPSLQTLNKDRLLLCYGFSVFLLFFINFCCFSLIQCCWQ